MGACNSGDEFNIATDPIIQDVPTKAQKIIDGILTTGREGEDLEETVRKILTRCREYGVTIFPKKLKYGLCVKFAVYLVQTRG